ncbi:antibiotic ABC transporter permease [Haloferax sp. MBLA0076]|uniref:Antibiotic ABC transporter permease n=1 Tax=Haloferax litoreum TaxID=2666140 RepID=A0A6A8GP02_9EURY|nr:MULTISPECIES: antibiotic ABC transporter permease [Haloferax]KAB1189959.1 antibiotic ABC transporter permease [Haloferax sp. CBA1148]MRX23730.1 antibiotic ABC transporter permease [Haloferax litoreum]
MNQHSPIQYHHETAVDIDRLQQYVDVLDDVLEYARDRDYSGWDYGDGMSSRVLHTIPFDNKWFNLAVQEFIKRSPVNVRPLFRVEQRRNFKGIALFAMANRTRAQIAPWFDGAGDPERYRSDAASLTEWLVDHQVTGYSGFGGSHRHRIQHPSGRSGPRETVPNQPNLVSTSYGVKALLAGAEFDSRYPGIAKSAVDLAVEDLDYRPTDDGAVMDYYLTHPKDSYTLNALAIGARYFIELYDHFGDEEVRERAESVFDFVASKQTERGGWYYREPPTSSHLSMDNHHNGFIIESLLRYEHIVGSGRYDDEIARGLDFYARELFDEDGAPNFDEENAYPRDIHATAQGILVFTYAGQHELAARAIDWALENMYVPEEGRFYFRKHRFYTKRTTLMRWCQAWMAYALSEFVASTIAGEPSHGYGIDTLRAATETA